MEQFTLPDFYINRDNELKEISYGLANYNSVLVVGPAGIGKTALIKTYAQQNPLNFTHINYIHGFEFEYNESKISLLDLPKTNETNLTIIDGIDEILSITKTDHILNLVKEGRKYGHKIIITSRPYFAELGILNNSYGIKLKGFSDDEALRLIRNRLVHTNFNESTIVDIRSILETIKNSPLAINAATELINSANLTPRDILQLLNEKIKYKNSELDYDTNSKIIIPEIPKIISDVKVINTTLVERVRRNPNIIYSMSSRQFEEFVANLFEKDGYKVQLTQQTHDGGKDLFIVESKRLGKFIYYVECKKYSPDNPVGVRLVRELYGTVIADRATAGLLVTSSYFSDEAKSFTEQIRSQMSLMEFVDLKKWVLDL